MDAERRMRIELEAVRQLMLSLESEGVDTADSGLVENMIEGETDFLEAVDHVLAKIDAAESAISGLVEREAIYEKRRKRLEARVERLRAMIEQAMSIAELKTVHRPAATLSLSRVGPKLVVEDEAAIPARYFRPAKPAVDRTALKQALDSGERIDGVRLTQGGVALGIRR